jgi:hypothetical protein
VGFRAPIVPAAARTHALIVPVLNFAWLAGSGAARGSAVFGQPIELDLMGRGIRCLDGSPGNYFVIAGPPGDFPGAYPNDFRLYTWTGNQADRPQQRHGDLTDLNPEGLVTPPPLPWTENTVFEIITDNGRRLWYGDDIMSKFLPVRAFRKFRTDLVALGPIVTPEPVVTSTEVDGTGVTVVWRSLLGLRYRLQYKDHLQDPTWKSVGDDVLAPGPYTAKQDNTPRGSHRFYRVQVLP